MSTQDPKYHQKAKAISSAEPNYLSQFEMRYPVPQITSQTMRHTLMNLVNTTLSQKYGDL